MTDVTGKNVFISGPMTGRDHNNILAFLDAHEKLNKAGATRVYDPAYEWYAEVNKGEEHHDHDYYMRRCVQTLAQADMFSEFMSPHFDLLVSLPGWQDSEGATLERSVAMACGIAVCDLSEVVGDD